MGWVTVSTRRHPETRLGGFGTAGQPMELIDALRRHGAKDLTVVNNNAGNGDRGLAALLKARCARPATGPPGPPYGRRCDGPHPSPTKNAVTVSRSAMVMPIWSKRRTCGMGPSSSTRVVDPSRDQTEHGPDVLADVAPMAGSGRCLSS
jgi:hypothetical protein